MAEEDPEIAALRAKLDHELSKPVKKNDLNSLVATSAVKTVIGVVISLLLASWLVSSCLGVAQSVSR